MGGDAAVCQAARNCLAGENTKQVSDDRALIRRLMRDRHTSPFEFVEFKFLCQMPIFVARQWVRHRTASLNEMSGRYGSAKLVPRQPNCGDRAWTKTRLYRRTFA